MENNDQSSLFYHMNNNDTENDNLTNNQESISRLPQYVTINISVENFYYIKKFFQLKDIIVNLHLNSANEEIEEKNNLPALNIEEIKHINDNEIDSVCYSQYISLSIDF